MESGRISINLIRPFPQVKLPGERRPLGLASVTFSGRAGCGPAARPGFESWLSHLDCICLSLCLSLLGCRAPHRGTGDCVREQWWLTFGEPPTSSSSTAPGTAAANVPATPALAGSDAGVSLPGMTSPEEGPCCWGGKGGGEDGRARRGSGA